MSIDAWCYEGRHVGTKPKYSQPCPSKECTCPCHGREDQSAPTSADSDEDASEEQVDD